MSLRPVTDAELLYYRNRLNYTHKAIEFAAAREPRSMLELGPAFLRVFIGSDVMGLDRNFLEPTYLHDATVTPWPIADKAYDVFIALQVWEHLKGRQREAFAEARRIARCAVLSFPLMWQSCALDDDHYMITEETIAEWTLHETPADRAVVRDAEQRLVLAFDFGDRS